MLYISHVQLNEEDTQKHDGIKMLVYDSEQSNGEQMNP